jgi:hypothetical protein
VISSGRSSKYTQSYFAGFADESYEAAVTLLPDIYALHPFHSVVDFGCGSGAWLRAANGLLSADDPQRRLTGVDGPHARSIAQCADARFIFQDLEDRVTLDHHDLAICLEVAEHLSPERGETLIDDICSVSDVVFFGAAVDGQGGVDHRNERPQSYWASVFARRGYRPFIFHRVRHWANPVFERCPYYIANSFLYVKEGHPTYAANEKLRAGPNDILDIVHPNWLRLKKPENVPFLHLAKQLMPSLLSAIRRRLP